MAVSLKGCGFDGLGQFNVQLVKSTPTNELSKVSSSVSKSSDDGVATVLCLPEAPQVINISCTWGGTFVYVRVGSWEACYCSSEWHDALSAAANTLPRDSMLCNVWRCGSDLLVKITDGRVLNVSHSSSSTSDSSGNSGTSCNLEEIEQLCGLLGCECCHDGRPYYLLPGGRVCVGRDYCLMDHKVNEVSCGADHTLLLMEDGSLYSRGIGTRGQLGHGDILPRTGPCVIEALWGVAVKDVACGLWHSAALSADGDVYSWGWNVEGQLGHSAACQVVTLPGLLELEMCSAVSCGARHTAVLCMSRNEATVSCESRNQDTTSCEPGLLFVYGWNDYQQTSCDNSNNVLFLACGRWSTLFLQKSENVSD